MPLQVKNDRQFRRWQARADDRGLEVTVTKRKKKVKRPREQYAHDEQQALAEAKTEIARVVIGRALERMDQEGAGC